MPGALIYFWYLNGGVLIQGAKKVGFTACQSGKLLLVCTSPTVFKVAQKKFYMSSTDCSSSVFEFPPPPQKKTTCPLDKFRTRFTSPIEKSTSPRLLDTTSFARCLLETGSLFTTGCLFLFWETTECSKQNFNIYWQRNDNSNCNCNSNKYTVNVQLMWGNFSLFLCR